MEANYLNEKSISWQLFGLERSLKNLTIISDNSSSFSEVIQSLSNITVEELRTELDWFFFIKNVRRCIKKVDKSDHLVCQKAKDLVYKISNGSHLKNNTEHVLKLLITCKERGFEVTVRFKNMLEMLYIKYQNFIDIEMDEFIFVDCEMRRKCTDQRILRYLILLDPLEGMKRSCFGVDDEFWFVLMSFNDSELIKFLRSLFDRNISRFFKFYSFIIANELICVDFIIDQLLTDSLDLLELFLAVFSVIPTDVIGAEDFKNFHVLFNLKLELFSSKFPFNCRILRKKLEKFIKNIE